MSDLALMAHAMRAGLDGMRTGRVFLALATADSRPLIRAPRAARRRRKLSAVHTAGGNRAPNPTDGRSA